MTPVNFGAMPSLGTTLTLPAGCSTPTAAAVDGTNDRLIIIDNTSGSVCAQPLSGAPGSILGTLSVSPLNIAIHAGADTAVITNDSAGTAVEVSLLDLLTDTFSPVLLLPNPAGGAAQTGTPVVTTGTASGVSYALVVTSYANGEHYAFLINLDLGTLVGSGTLLDIGAPRALQSFSTSSAVLVTADGMAHILSIDVTTGAGTIDTSLTVGSDPMGVAIDEATSRAFVTNNGSDTLSILDLTPGSESVLSTLSLGMGPTQIGFKDGLVDQLAIIHDGEDFVIVLSE